MAANLECDISRSGGPEKPADNKVNVRRTTNHGVILLEVPVPGIVVQQEDRKAVRTIIEDALVRLRDAVAAKLG
jgi:hypothetical protein